MASIPEMHLDSLTDADSPANRAVIAAFAKLDKTALGFAVGTVCGFGIFLATVVLVVKGGDPVGPNLGLLGQFFFGYTVTTGGAFLGLLYGLAFGFIMGWLIAFFRNLLISAYLLMMKTRANLSSSLESLD
jgi:hypothetical protein